VNGTGFQNAQEACFGYVIFGVIQLKMCGIWG
jgi:hypothetical protein